MNNTKHHWSYYLGITLLILGHLILLAGFIMPLLGASIGLISFTLITGEITVLLSIVALGKKGSKHLIDNTLKGFADFFTSPIGKLRHYTGIFLVLFNGFVAWGIAILVLVAPTIEQAKEEMLVMIILGEIAFLLGIYVLGADWWAQFQSLFKWTPSSSYVEKTAARKIQ